MTQDQGQKDGEWGPWVEHDGSAKAPNRLRVGDLVQFDLEIFFKREFVVIRLAAEHLQDWVWESEAFRRIVRYRICKPRDLRALFNLPEEVPAPVQPQQVDA